MEHRKYLGDDRAFEEGRNGQISFEIFVDNNELMFFFLFLLLQFYNNFYNNSLNLIFNKSFFYDDNSFLTVSFI